jgi:hypothetical protein
MGHADASSGLDFWLKEILTERIHCEAHFSYPAPDGSLIEEPWMYVSDLRRASILLAYRILLEITDSQTEKWDQESGNEENSRFQAQLLKGPVSSEFLQNAVIEQFRETARSEVARISDQKAMWQAVKNLEATAYHCLAHFGVLIYSCHLKNASILEQDFRRQLLCEWKEEWEAEAFRRGQEPQSKKQAIADRRKQKANQDRQETLAVLTPQLRQLRQKANVSNKGIADGLSDILGKTVSEETVSHHHILTKPKRPKADMQRAYEVFYRERLNLPPTWTLFDKIPES